MRSSRGVLRRRSYCYSQAQAHAFSLSGCARNKIGQVCAYFLLCEVIVWALIGFHLTNHHASKAFSEANSMFRMRLE